MTRTYLADLWDEAIAAGLDEPEQLRFFLGRFEPVD